MSRIGEAVCIVVGAALGAAIAVYSVLLWAKHGDTVGVLHR